MDDLASWLGRSGFLPHGYCFTWRPSLLWPMVGADAAIAAAYYSIPLALVHFVRRRPETTFNGIVLLFSAFIFACGTTHVLSIWTIWVPDYGLETALKIATAIISVVTAVLLWPLIPRALKIPSVSELQAAIARLEAEVAQRQRAEAGLEETQQSLDITLASIGAGILSIDLAGRVTRMNPLAEQITGWSAVDAGGRPLREVWRREDMPADGSMTSVVETMISERSSIDVVQRTVAVSRDGRRTPIEVKAALNHTKDGAVSGATFVFRDMTRLDEAETRARQLAAIVESSTDAIVGQALDGRITHWNRGAEVMFGYPAAAAVGQAADPSTPASRRGEEARALHELTRGQRVAPIHTVRQRNDGSLIDVSVTVSPVQDRDGRLLGVSKIARDISEHKRNEELRLKGIRLEAENRQIQEANRLKSEFVANMSHELRTPLNAVIGYADLLYRGKVPTESPRFREFLGHISTSGKHLLRLINDVLDLSKVESGKLEFFPEAVDLGRLIGEVTAILRSEAARKNVSIGVDLEPGLDDIVVDAARLRQVLYNYLSNAIKFTASGGSVVVRTRAEGSDRFRVEVQDNGIGIAAADLPRLFTQFLQLDSGYTKRYEGTGLGLALTRRLAEAQGGSVGVRSELGVGSVFHVVLPRQGTAEAVSPPSAALVAPSAPEVLVIEDDPRDRRELAEVLDNAGLHAVFAASAGQAIELAAGRRFAAITLDLLLPDRTGLEVLAQIRDSGPNRNTPVVVISIAADEAHSAAFAISDVLTKPIERDAVLAALANAGVNATSRGRVLVVDDDRGALTLIAEVLEGAGIDVVCHDDGRRALAELDFIEPDAVVLDLAMPGFDGFEVLEALRERPGRQSLPVFIWTGKDLERAEYDRLVRSACTIMSKGRGNQEALLEALRRDVPRLLQVLG